MLLDYGCGEGRIVVQAVLRYPFKKVIGLDISEKLAAVASEEVVRNHDRFRVGEVELVVGDAAEWPLPDDITYVHMYKPFGDGVFCSALDRIIESLERRPRPLTLVYARPLFDSVVLANGRFRLIRFSRGLRRDLDSHRIHVHVSC